MCDFVSFSTEDVMLKAEGNLLSNSMSFLVDGVPSDWSAPYREALSVTSGMGVLQQASSPSVLSLEVLWRVELSHGLTLKFAHCFVEDRADLIRW